MIKTQNRDIPIDFLKALAIIGVLFIHTCLYTFPMTSIAGMTNVFFGSLFRFAVPIFLMCSGAMMLDPDKNITTKAIYTKYLPRLIIAMLFGSVLYKISHLILVGNLTFRALLISIKEIIFFNQEFHMYYMHMIILVYIFLPITRIITKYCDQKKLLYVLAVWFALGIAYPSIAATGALANFTGMFLQYRMNMVYASIGYGILGYYLKKYPLKKLPSLLLTAIGFATVFVGTLYLSIKQGSLNSIYFEGMSVGVCLYAAGLFSLSRHIKSFGPFTKPIVYLSNASFCIYLVHVFFLVDIRKYIGMLYLPQVIHIPLCVLAFLVICCAIYFILSHIPVVKKYLI